MNAIKRRGSLAIALPSAKTVASGSRSPMESTPLFRRSVCAIRTQESVVWTRFVIGTVRQGSLQKNCTKRNKHLWHNFSDKNDDDTDAPIAGAIANIKREILFRKICVPEDRDATQSHAIEIERDETHIDIALPRVEFEPPRIPYFPCPALPPGMSGSKRSRPAA